MIKVLVMVLMLAALFGNCMSQNNELAQIKVIKEFIFDLKQGTTNQSLINKFLVVSDNSEKSLEYVNLQLDALRDQIKSFDNIVVERYDAEDLILSDEERNETFAISNNEKQMLPILMSGNKIKSFSTLNKGGKKVFMIL